ncbi:hypothetical protein VIBHAR_05347 [Vibrio campbellii ATCC BAA-1116]|uniref:Uncharacterized protein n=1 Tax=Vibrio campbellii (strain ATCC BAA-1116) TaxID=2902295 RepID=A7N3Y5_VIBC1|nr:hypothetical protein VIBHAR_05347 [Vibrio campbellii ATCC BAA-1116]
MWYQQSRVKSVNVAHLNAGTRCHAGAFAILSIAFKIKI